MVAEWDALEARMLMVRAKLAPDQRDAYYQLIEYPIAAMANLYRMYYGTAWNRLLASKNDARANYFANMVETAFRRDGELVQRYHSINGGKWNGMMAQVHMSYVIWNDPTQQTMPSIVRIGADTPTDRRQTRPKFIDRSPAPQGIVAVEATAFNRAHDGKGLNWTPISHLGRTGGGMIALPQGRPATTQEDAVRLDYDMTVQKAGPATVTLYLAPTLDTSGHGGSRIGVSIGNAPMQVLQISLEATGGDQKSPATKRWADAVCDNVVRLSAKLGDVGVGRQTVRVWRLDDNVVLQKLVLATVAEPQSYLGAR
jgi:hypothetical protein